MKLIFPLFRSASLLLLAGIILTGCIDPRKARQEAFAARTAVYTGDWKTVETQMEKATKADRRHAGYWGMLGRARYELGKYGPAREAMELGKLQHNQKRSAEACKNWQEAKDIYQSADAESQIFGLTLLMAAAKCNTGKNA